MAIIVEYASWRFGDRAVVTIRHLLLFGPESLVGSRRLWRGVTISTVLLAN